jgi:hypothetical protein
MSDALRACMALRTFLAADGTRWSVWRVEPAAFGSGPRTLTAWLAFVDERGKECRRLFEVPPNWEALPAERLDLLRRIAEPACSRGMLWLPVGVEYQPSCKAERGASSRTFTDGGGVAWQVWEVRPTLMERRRMRERRGVARHDAPQRRAGVSRPLVAVHESLRDGWLAFRSDSEHRRRAPIPDGWTEMSDHELCALLDSALRFERGRRAG